MGSPLVFDHIYEAKKRGADSEAGESSVRATKTARTEKNGDGGKRRAKKAATTVSSIDTLMQ